MKMMDCLWRTEVMVVMEVKMMEMMEMMRMVPCLWRSLAAARARVARSTSISSGMVEWWNGEMVVCFTCIWSAANKALV